MIARLLLFLALARRQAWEALGFLALIAFLFSLNGVSCGKGKQTEPNISNEVSDHADASKSTAATPGLGNWSDCPGCPKYGLNGLNGEGGEEEIPPICWAEGVITGILRSPSSFDPARAQFSQITINLSQGANNLTVRILNSLSQEVKVLYSGSANAPSFQTTWDGKDSANQQARYSIYLIDAVARDERNQVIGSGQCDLILYKPKAGISMQNADKYRNAQTHEWLKSSDEFVGAGLVNPGDSVAVTFDGQPISLANICR